jgi:hypothetical protein
MYEKEIIQTNNLAKNEKIQIYERYLPAIKSLRFRSVLIVSFVTNQSCISPNTIKLSGVNNYLMKLTGMTNYKK